MNTEVRYYSRSGNTKAVAEAISEAAGVKALSVDAGDSAIREVADVLFIGGALYAYGIDPKLKKYIKTLKKENIKKAVVFSTTWISKHSIDLIKIGLREQGIDVEEEFLYFRGKPSPDQLKEAELFARKFV